MDNIDNCDSRKPYVDTTMLKLLHQLNSLRVLCEYNVTEQSYSKQRFDYFTYICEEQIFSKLSRFLRENDSIELNKLYLEVKGMYESKNIKGMIELLESSLNDSSFLGELFDTLRAKNSSVFFENNRELLQRFHIHVFENFLDQ